MPDTVNHYTNMTRPKPDLIPTSIRLDKETLRQLSEAASFQQTSRTELVRFAIAEILVRWQAERRAFLEKLIEA
jgi:predicted transcriptional regulator